MTQSTFNELADILDCEPIPGAPQEVCILFLSSMVHWPLRDTGNVEAYIIEIQKYFGEDPSFHIMHPLPKYNTNDWQMKSRKGLAEALELSRRTCKVNNFNEMVEHLSKYYPIAK